MKRVQFNHPRHHMKHFIPLLMFPLVFLPSCSEDNSNSPPDNGQYIGYSEALANPERVRTLILLTEQQIPSNVSVFINLETLASYSKNLEYVDSNVSACTKLSRIDVHESKIDTLPLGFCRLPQLEELDFSVGNLKIIPDEIGNLRSSLKTLYLRGNPIPDTTKIKLKQSRPNTKILY